MTLSPEVLAKLDASRAALRGTTATAAVTDDEHDEHPLVWNGERYLRHPVERILNDAYGEPIPPAQIQPGWWVWSTSQTWAAEGSPVERQGICVAVVPDDECAPVYVCVEQFRSRIDRLDVTADDVHEAVVATSRDLTALRRALHTALGDRRGPLRVHCDKRWLEGVALTIGGLVDG